MAKRFEETTDQSIEVRVESDDPERQPNELYGDLRPGMKLRDPHGERYRILDRLGEGGMGSVFRVEDEKMERPVALKLLHEDLTRYEHAVGRFKRELKAMARINSPFVAKVHDVVDISYGKQRGEQIAIVTEFVDGRDMFDTLRDVRVFSPERAAMFAAQIALGLQAAHDQGVIHRDMKPENVLIQKVQGQEIAKVTDFGIAGIREDMMKEGAPEWADKRSYTAKGTVFGTPEYLSPEQAAASDDVDGRADLYSLGIIMYRMLAGHLPFRGGNKMALVQRQISEMPKPFGMLNMRQEVPDWLEKIVFKLLAKNPDDRYQSGTEVYQALKEAVMKHYPEYAENPPFNELGLNKEEGEEGQDEEAQSIAA